MVYEETIPNSQSTIRITHIVHNITSPFCILDLKAVYCLPVSPLLLQNFLNLPYLLLNFTRDLFAKTFTFQVWIIA